MYDWDTSKPLAFCFVLLFSAQVGDNAAECFVALPPIAS